MGIGTNERSKKITHYEMAEKTKSHFNAIRLISVKDYYFTMKTACL